MWVSQSVIEAVVRSEALINTDTTRIGLRAGFEDPLWLCHSYQHYAIALHFTDCPPPNEWLYWFWYWQHFGLSLVGGTEGRGIKVLLQTLFSGYRLNSSTLHSTQTNTGCKAGAHLRGSGRKFIEGSGRIWFRVNCYSEFNLNLVYCFALLCYASFFKHKSGLSVCLSSLSMSASVADRVTDRSLSQ